MELFRQQAYIGGRWCEADNGTDFQVTNPATGELLGQVPDMGAAETRRAIEAAKAAWPGWRRKTAKERANLLRKWHDLMMANLDDLAGLMTATKASRWLNVKGKSFTLPLFMDGSRGGQTRLWRHYPITLEQSAIGCREGTGRRLLRHNALEFRGGNDYRKAGPALAAGCTMVAKPAINAVIGVCARRAGGARGIPQEYLTSSLAIRKPSAAK